jgi:hypothetical protein
MEKHRIYYARQAETELRSLETYKQRTQETIERCRNSTAEGVIEKIGHLRTKLEEYDQKIEEKRSEMEEFRSGQRDDQINLIINKQAHELKRKQHENSRKKQEEKEELIKAKKRADHYFQRGDNRNRKRFASNREMGYEFRRFERNCDKIPSYLHRNLKNMPNNKGYIWRGIWLLGNKPSERGQPLIMFERKNKDTLIIHEIDYYKARTYEKKGKARKTLIKTVVRRRH